MHYQWYPGHMMKAKRMMQENIKLIDLIIELLDARVPYASGNPDISELGKNKSRLIILNKADLADETVNDAWVKHYMEQGLSAVLIDARSGKGMKSVEDCIALVCRDKIERDRKRGILNRPIRAMVVGIPNVGKSTFINSLAGKACAKTGNKPGVTKGKQWIRLNKNIELLDTPGLLWPKFEDQTVGEHLAMVGSINDEILDTEEMAVALIAKLRSGYAEAIAKRFGVDENGNAYDVLQRIARKRGCLKKGDEPDTNKASRILLDEFRSGRIGRISLERP
ncbi:MAG: ribosome biogenesis GTPase YlqF [Lachnospiraceae bacterium]|nr:ribosome biogenesis GTPase YlqF [Lachnospiraceae bacterium]